MKIVWKYFSSVNITLSVYIIIQNSLIICHYRHDWKKLSSILFILIAAADIGFAFTVTELGRDILTFQCITKSPSWQVNTRTPLFWILTGYLFNATSAFLCLTLTIIKTVNIMNPFYRLNSCAIHAALFIVQLLYFVLNITDNISAHWLISYVSHGNDRFECYNSYGLFGLVTEGWLGEYTILYLCFRFGVMRVNDYLVVASVILSTYVLSAWNNSACVYGPSNVLYQKSIRPQ